MADIALVALKSYLMKKFWKGLRWIDIRTFFSGYSQGEVFLAGARSFAIIVRRSFAFIARRRSWPQHLSHPDRFFLDDHLRFKAE